MNLLASAFANIPIISLQTGEAVAWSRQLIIEISSLAVVALLCESPGYRHNVVLMTKDIRQMATDCAIVDSEDELTAPGDLVRLASVLAAKYDPIGKAVVSDLGRKLGTVEDCSINLDTFHIDKLFVRQSVLKAWLGTNLTIDRSQIVDVTPRQIVVRDAAVNIEALNAKPATEGLP